MITPAAVATISTIFAAVMLHERPGFVRLAGSALLIAGITLIGWDGLRGVSGPKVWLGDLLFLAAAVAWALFSVLVRRVLASPQYPLYALSNLLQPRLTASDPVGFPSDRQQTIRLRN